MYNNFEELLKYCTANACPISEAVMRNEERLTGRTRDEIMNNLRDMYSVMSAEAEKALDKPLSAGFSLIAGQASTQNAYAKAGDTICGDMINRLMARALSCSETNAAMGRICAAPTAGAVEMKGGTPAQALDAEAFALKNVMGLVCDPVAGLVQVPCALRNASQAVNALLSADLALGGMKSLIPLDEVVEAMYNVGHMLPTQLRETALGGIAATPTGVSVRVNMHK